MKKVLLVPAILLVLPLLAGCNNNGAVSEFKNDLVFDEKLTDNEKGLVISKLKLN